MAFALHEANYIVLDTGSYNTKVIKGLVDVVNQLPTLIYSARVLQNGSSTLTKSTLDTTQEQQTSFSKTGQSGFLDEPQNSVLTAPSTSTSNVQSNTIAELNVPSVGQSAPASPPTSPRTREAQWSAFVCGKDAFPGGLDQEMTIRYPLIRGEIEDWEALEALWRHIIFGELAIRRSRNESPVIVTVPIRWPREHYERISQMLFEEFNVPGIYFAEQPLMALYGIGTASGLVVDVGAGTTDIAPVIEGLVQYSAAQTIDLAGVDLDVYFCSILAADSITVSELGETPTVEFARFVKESGICQVLEDPDALFPSPKEKETVTETQSQNTVDLGSGKDRGPKNSSGESSGAEKEKEKASSNAAKKRVELQWRGKKVTIGAARYRVADPLFNPDLINRECLSLPEAIHTAVMACEPEKRPTCMGNVVLTGGVSALPGLRERLEKELHRFLAISECSSEMQGTAARFLYVPEYFAALKDKTEYASFLGAEIAGKHVFVDPKFYIAKSDYNEHGPAAAWIGKEDSRR